MTAMRGRFPCRNLVCSVFTGNHGRTQRRCWTSSCACLVSTSSMTPRSNRVTRRLMRITPRITPAHHRARTRMEALHRHTSEALHRGHNGIDLHLGQKPKLGGRYTDITHSSIYHILSVLCISMFRFFLSFCSLLLYSCFSKHKKTKNISVVSLWLFL